MTAPTITIRMTNPKDAPEILRLKDEVWLDTYPSVALRITAADLQAHLDIDSIQNRMARWRQNLTTTSTTQSWVAVAEGQLIGFVSAIRGGTRNEIKAIYILPSFQGQGIGKRLLGQALTWLGPRKDIRLCIVEHLTSAIEACEKLGFVRTGPAPDKLLILPSGTPVPVLELVKPAEEA
jgi:GNAT superfamily N-acetyltransferase